MQFSHPSRRSLIRHSWIAFVVAPIGVAVLWQILAAAHAYDQSIVPSPFTILRAVFALAREGFLLSDIAATVTRVLIGYSIAVIAGFAAGLCTGLSARFRFLAEPLLQIGRPIPALALVPLAISWFGIGEFSKLFIVVWAAFYPIWINTHVGVQQTPTELLWTAALLGADSRRTVIEVVIPSSVVYLLSGARIGLGLAFAATVVAEMSGADSGLGYRVFVNHLVFRFDRMIGGILIIGLLGATIDRIYVWLTFRIFPWTRRQLNEQK
jgi:ABC-type nitrate/sulfonate/bicarbonate transport system permease component